MIIAHVIVPIMPIPPNLPAIKKRPRLGIIKVNILPLTIQGLKKAHAIN
jgi:hypothetical protein